MLYDDFITQLLNMEDSLVKVDNIETDLTEKVKYVHISTKPVPAFCEKCGSRMHSKGHDIRKPVHSMLQDGFKLVLVYKQRRWKCTNPDCAFSCYEKISFLKKNRRCTDLVDMMIVDSFRDIRLTASQIAQKFHVSDTAAIYTFMRYVDMKRLPLTKAICIDEVHIGSQDCRYAVIIQDFITGEPIDMKQSRKDSVMQPYLLSIPKKERLKVEFLVSDMFNAYISYAGKYFPNAVSVVDSFHVVQMINSKLKTYMISKEKEFKARDKERERVLQLEKGNPGLHLPMSDEVYLYGRCRWVILKNRDTLTCQIPHKPDRHFRYFMDIYDYEEKFRKTDPQLMLMRDLKEEYIQFNSRNSGNRDNAEKELPLLIDKYLSSGVDEFADIARSLKKYYEPILNSFITLERTGSKGPYHSRLSNGPMEGLNRKPKDMKRICRGFDNFEHLRNRFLFAERKNAPVLASPRSISQVRDDSFTGAKRGSYTKSKNTLFKDSEP